MTDVSGITSTMAYDMYGNVVSGTGGNGVPSTVSTTSTTNYAAPSEITVGSSLTTSMTYNDAFLGLTNETGPNGTSVSLGYDANARPTSSTSPFGATTQTIYNDTASPPNTCTIVNGRWTQTNLDGLGRPITTLTGNGSTCGSGTTVSQSETTYGSCGCSPLGKMMTQTVPHAPGAAPSAIATTTYTYDGIGRTASKATVGALVNGSPDTQGTTGYSYLANTVTVTDPAGKKKTFTTDAFGNLVKVVEDPSGLAYATTYTYDLLSHLTGVSMTRSNGTQTRSFVYSGNFLTDATNPENGHVHYTYGAYSNVASRTDAKGQVVVYSYDSYARLSKVQRYPSGTNNPEDTCQQENYSYDSGMYGLGHLTSVQYMGGYNSAMSPTCDTTFTETYTYGLPGAPVSKSLGVSRAAQWYSDSNTISSLGLTLGATFSYDNEGRMTGETYPTDNSGTTASVGYSFDSMGRLYSMTDVLHSATIIGSASYGPAGELTALGSIETRTYNSLKQLTGVGSMTYHYPTTGNNGKIDYDHDSAGSGETVTYLYDSLNRLQEAQSSSNWSQTFTYDGFGNLTSVAGVNAPGFSGPCCDASNHSGSEDTNGNSQSVPMPAYGTSGTGTYDVENRLASVVAYGNPGIYYSYGPGNKRVWRKTASIDEITFWSAGGQKLAAYNLTSDQGCCVGSDNFHAPQFYATQTTTNYYFGGRLIKNGNNASNWVLPDRLGSIGKFYPYGGERPTATGNDKEKFTGYFRDAETGNDYADQRYESPGTGRFLTPDPSMDNVDLADPGSWNAYVYTNGDPINSTDTNGLSPTFSGNSDCGSMRISGGVFDGESVSDVMTGTNGNDLLAQIIWHEGGAIFPGSDLASSTSLAAYEQDLAAIGSAVLNVLDVYNGNLTVYSPKGIKISCLLGCNSNATLQWVIIHIATELVNGVLQNVFDSNGNMIDGRVQDRTNILDTSVSQGYMITDASGRQINIGCEGMLGSIRTASDLVDGSLARVSGPNGLVLLAWNQAPSNDTAHFPGDIGWTGWRDGRGKYGETFWGLYSTPPFSPVRRPPDNPGGGRR